MGRQQRLHRRAPAQRNGVVEAEPKGGTKALEGAHCGGRHGRLGARLDGPGHVWIGFLQCRKTAASVGMEGAYRVGGNVLVHLGANFDLDNRLAGVRGSSNGSGLGTTPGGSPSAFRLPPVGRPRCGRFGAWACIGGGKGAPNLHDAAVPLSAEVDGLVEQRFAGNVLDGPTVGTRPGAHQTGVDALIKSAPELLPGTFGVHARSKKSFGGKVREMRRVFRVYRRRCWNAG